MSGETVATNNQDGGIHVAKGKESEKNQKDKDQKKDQQQPNDENEKKDSNKKDKGDEDKRPEPQPSKLSQQQAENLLKALQQDERKVQDKLQQGEAMPVKLDKDW